MAKKRFEALPPGMFSVDEPIAGDALARDRYAEAFARLAAGCETPMVVGLYGTWGSGKSSLMMRIREKLKEGGIPTAWFDPWQHQAEEEPVVALLQKMMADLGREKQQKVKDLLTGVALGLSAPLLKITTGVNVADLGKLAETFAEEGFRIRSEQIRLREKIEDLIGTVSQGSGRVVVFIDDLDRCLPTPMIRMLEALKLYLNARGCVYFLGIDDEVVRKAINAHFEVKIEDQDYLDKIIQVPFKIPRIHAATARTFIAGLLPEDAEHCAEFLVEFLGDNPRRVKRFTNNLSLNLLMAPEIFKEEGGEYSVDLIVIMLLIQIRNRTLWGQIEARPPLYLELRTSEEEEARRVLQDVLGGDTQLQGLIQRVDCPQDTPLEKYVLLTDVAGASVREETTVAIEPEMVPIPPGEFLMGSSDDDEQAYDDEKPQHPVAIRRHFAVGRYPVTFAEYDRFAETMERTKPSDRGWGRGRRPVINVSWSETQVYAEWLRGETGKEYRLLSEAEWEYACRAGSATRYSFGDDPAELGDHAWFGGNSESQTHPVGQKQPNGFGLHDMHGNVGEWVEDGLHRDYKGAPDGGGAWIEGGDKGIRVLRGGCWYNGPGDLRSAVRNWDHAGDRSGIVGFRLARTLS